MPLSASADRTPENLPEWLHWVDTCPSTNTWASDRASELQHGDVVFTRRQTSGRGQQGRIWYAPTGVLTASFVCDRLPVTKLPGLSLAAALAVIYAIEDLLPNCQDLLRLKWPNDVLINERKLAGILCEATSSNTSKNVRAILGIGLNRCVNFAEAGLDINAVSLHEISGIVPDEVSLLERLRHYLLEASGILAMSDMSAENAGLAKLLPELRHRDMLRDRTVTLELPEKSISGQAVGIDALGRLLIRLSDNRVQAFNSGRVRWDMANG
ncbi:MAG TPA: biotin--[acetyl-CoA-carboxylase] ligase [Kamptonema sp.]|nr:biotin--[acetyl-CoA-carboxylase] ligase [Kamptonema sp.]